MLLACRLAVTSTLAMKGSQQIAHDMMVLWLLSLALECLAQLGQGGCCAVQTRLLNGSAVCNMRMGRWEEAEQQLMEALEKDAKSADTLANLVTTCLHLGKATSRYNT